MAKLFAFLHRWRRPLGLAALLLAMLALLAGVWLVEVRPCESKTLSARLNDSYEAATPPLETALSQEFTTDQPLTGLAFVFYCRGGQPAGALELALYDADTGALLASSTGRMEHLIDGQYAGLGLDLPLPAGAAARYRLELAPHYETDARIALGRSEAPAWGDCALLADGEPLPGSLAILASTRAIGRFVSVFYWAIGLLLAALVGAAYWLASARRGRFAGWPLHRRYALLAAGLGLVFCLVLPPYAAPDEQFHINQAFSGATRLATCLDFDGWHLRAVPLATTFRRPSDQNARIEDERTTVFIWQAVSEEFFTLSPDAFGSHAQYDEPQADVGGELYFFSTLGVFLGFVLHLGFVPTLFLGRLANLAAYTLLTAWAVKRSPVAKPVFAAAGLLPMSLHLAASFSRDSLLLGLAFLYTALCLEGAFGAGAAAAAPLPRRQLLLIAAVGLLLAPAKSVYLPLCGLCLLIPAARLGRRGRAKLAGFLAACLLMFALSGARYAIAGFLQQAIPAAQQAEAASVEGGALPDEGGADAPGEPGEPAEPAELSAGAVDPDSICFSAAYILAHPGLTVQLLLRSLTQNADHYIKTLVGGKLSYYSLEIGWGWVVACYLLLAAACRAAEGGGRPGAAAGAEMLPAPGEARRIARARALAGLLALASAGLAVLGCVSWTPTYYETIYGLQGRYFLPVLPAALLALCPAGCWRAAGETGAAESADAKSGGAAKAETTGAAAETADGAETAASPAARLLLGFAAVNAGVLVNAMLAVMAR